MWGWDRGSELRYAAAKYNTLGKQWRPEGKTGCPKVGSLAGWNAEEIRQARRALLEEVWTSVTTCESLKMHKQAGKPGNKAENKRAVRNSLVGGGAQNKRKGGVYRNLSADSCRVGHIIMVWKKERIKWSKEKKTMEADTFHMRITGQGSVVLIMVSRRSIKETRLII